MNKEQVDFGNWNARKLSSEAQEALRIRADQLKMPFAFPVPLQRLGHWPSLSPDAAFQLLL